MHIRNIISYMHGNKVTRKVQTTLRARLGHYPVVALLGPRQVGKSTLAKLIAPESLRYLDLERTSDLNKLTDPEAYFTANAAHLICLDEIQRLPDIFPLLRSMVDISGRNGQFLLLGSASRDLLRQSSETLAGRISFLELCPFSADELPATNWQRHWLRGGYPRSFLAEDDAVSYQWRQDYIRTFLERDIPQIGFNIPANSLGRLWRMLAHVSGQTLNSAKLADSLGVSANTVRHYIDLLEQTFVLRTLPPFAGNLKKRLVKSPKVYIRDSGLLHALLEIETFDNLFANPAYGASFEGYVVENIVSALPDWRASFYRTSNGAELDLVLEKGQQRVAVEVKAATAPKPSRGFWQAIEDIQSTANYVVGQVSEAYPLAANVEALNLHLLLARLGGETRLLG
jgi:uncharacterized protein